MTAWEKILTISVVKVGDLILKEIELCIILDIQNSIFFRLLSLCCLKKGTSCGERLLSKLNLYSKGDRKLVISQDVIEDSAAHSHASLTLNILCRRAARVARVFESDFIAFEFRSL